MPITRRALLISNPGEVGAENYCKGVYVDIRNYTQFLLSPQGGAWDSSEIKHLDRPTAQNVRDWLAHFSTHDYVLVMFTGHGWYSSVDRDRILELRQNERLLSVELRKGSKKRTIILDCCQKVYNEPSKIVAKALSALANEAISRRTPDPATCRQLFFDSVRNSPDGIVFLTSCAIGELSTDDDTRGGRYNGSMMEVLADWTEAQSQIPTFRQFYGNSNTQATLSIVAAHEPAAEKTRLLSAGGQNPTIEKPRTSPYFPIAVFG